MSSAQHRLLKRRTMPGVALLFTVFCCVSGGPFGLEPAVSAAGPGVAMLLIAALPLLWALPDALTTCELAAAIPEEGGYVIWVNRAMGPFASFLNAWWTWLYSLVDASIYPVLFATYAAGLAKAWLGTTMLDGALAQWLLAAAMIATFSWLNFRGAKPVGSASIGLALAILVPFALFIVVGLFRYLGNPHLVPLSLPHGEGLKSSLAAGMGIVMWNYLGWDSLSTIAEEVDEPQRAYPRALLTGLLLVAGSYLLATWVGLAFVPDASKWVEGAWPDIAHQIGGPWLMALVQIGAVVSPIALFTASLLASSRVPFVLAEARFLPTPFKALHPKFGTPWFAIVFSAAVFALLATKTFQELVSLNVVMYSAALVLEIASLLILRVKEPQLPRPFRIPGGWLALGLVFILPIAMVGALVVLSIREEGWASQGLTMAGLASGPLVYAAIKILRPKEESPC